MNQIKGRRPNVDGDVRAVWDFHARKLRQVTFGAWFKKWSEAQVAAFRNPKTESDLSELCAHGCQEEVLFVLLYVVGHAPKLAALWVAMVGPPKKREKTSRVLERAAASLEDALAIVLAAEDEEAKGQLREMGGVSPSLLIAELKLYASYFKLAESS